MSSTDTRVKGEGYVVTEGGRRTDGAVHQDRAVAEAEAAKKKARAPLTEKAGQTPQVEVKQQLFG